MNFVQYIIMVVIGGVIRSIIAYSLTLLYSSLITIAIAFKYFFGGDKKFFERKERTVKPAVLSSSEYGEHKFITVNVSNFNNTIKS